MTHEDIIAEWEKDCVIDKIRLEDEFVKTHLQHAKYMRIRATSYITKNKIERKMAQLTRDKKEYYNGTLTEDKLKAYGWVPYGAVVMKGDIKMYVEADEDYIKLKYLLQDEESKIKTLEDIVKMINNKGYNLKEMNQRYIFENGGR